jgi:deoxyribodipyrimidine photo-lyase
MQKINFFWFRRDLRLEDNHALFQALTKDFPVQCVFIFDKNILNHLKPIDLRVSFVHKTLAELKSQLQKFGSDIWIFYDEPISVWQTLASHHEIDTVFCNDDYEPYARNRDGSIANLLAAKGINFQTYKDHVIFEKDEVTKDDGKPFVVYTPYSKVWKKHFFSAEVSYYSSENYLTNLNKTHHQPIIGLEEMGFIDMTHFNFPAKAVKLALIKNYEKTRDIPGIMGTSRLGIHFRFGTISIREKAKKAVFLNEKYLNELIWRDFYQMILWHFPKVQNQAFKSAYDQIEWLNDREHFEKWCKGLTGYPIVDAGMRELNETGFMHNRVRMICASFLTKHLLIDWRWGEAYFAEKLLDFDLASNNGGWQWAAGSGVDAAPYFRVFNPTLQMEKFDPQWLYIKKWVKEINTNSYPKPIIDHAFARKRCLDTYKLALAKPVFA